MTGSRLLLLSTLLAACAPPPAEDPAAAPDTLPPLPALSPDSMRNAVVLSGLRVPQGPRAEVRERLGAPDSVRSRPVENRHDPAQTDSIVELFYPGLRMEYYAVGLGGELLAEAEVRDNRYLEYPRLGVGSAERAVVAALGEPDLRSEGSLEYTCRGCTEAESPVAFHVVRDTVRGVSFRFYVD